MDNRNFAFGKRNFVALAAGIIVILIAMVFKMVESALRFFH